MVNGLLVVGLYMIVGTLSLLLIRRESRRHFRKIRIQDSIQPKGKVSYYTIVLISVFFTLFNASVTLISNGYGSDRLNYAYEFTGARSSTSVALDCIFKIVNSCGGNIETVFYLTTFICVFVTLLAYKKSSHVNSNVFCLLLTSEWILFTLTALKQAYACALACLFFVYAIEDTTRKGTIKAILCAGGASLFHISGLILFPILLLIKKKNMKKKTLFIWLFMLAIGIFAFEPLILVIADVIDNFIPIYAQKIRNYFVGEGNTVDGASMFAFIKYLPIYYVTALGLVYRKRYSMVIEGYNKLQFISALATCLVAYSTVSYWFSRFAGIFYFPIFVFYNLISSRINNRKKKMLSDLIVYGGGTVVLFRKILLIFINYGTI